MRTFLQLGRPVAGVLLCSALALWVAVLFAHRPFRSFVPIAFVLVIVLLGARFGLAASVLGACASALIFAYFLFPPLGSLRMDEKLARENTAWMVLGGVVLPFLLLAPGQRLRRK